MTRTLEILEQLVAFPTVSAQSNLALIDYAQNLLHRAGCTVTRIPSPCGQKAGLFARTGPEFGGVCLSAHTDVVPVTGQEWTCDPFTLKRRKDRVLGRGTTDMKGFLASALACAERAAKRPLREALTLSISYDEEIGCVGIRHMMPVLAPLLGSPRAVIVGEPTSMQVATGHKGKTALRVLCHGQSGHSALAPNFTNAIHLAAGFVGEMRDLQNDLAQRDTDSDYSVPYCTVHIGQIAGGMALNIVPDSAHLDMEFRYLASQRAEALFAEIEERARKVGTQFGNPDSIEVLQTNAYFGLDTAPEAPVVSWACDLAGGTSPTKVTFGTEAGFFANMGLDTVIIGPGDMTADGHKPDEGLNLDQLGSCDAMMDSLIDDLT